MELDTENLKYRQQDGSSLTDLNGIGLFTDEYEKEIKWTIQQDGMAEKKVESELFCFTIEKEKQSVESSLFLNSTLAAEPPRISEEESHAGVEGGMTALAVLVGIICVCYAVRRRKRK